MVVRSQGEKHLIKTVQGEWVRGRRGARDGRKMRGGGTREEQRTRMGDSSKSSRSSREERTGIVGEKVDLPNCKRGRG
jgi:hypothetical protein